MPGLLLCCEVSVVIRTKNKLRGCPMFDDVPLSMAQIKRFCDEGCCPSCLQILMSRLNRVCEGPEKVQEFADKLDARLPLYEAAV